MAKKELLMALEKFYADLGQMIQDYKDCLDDDGEYALEDAGAIASMTIKEIGAFYKRHNKQ